MRGQIVGGVRGASAPGFMRSLALTATLGAALALGGCLGYEGDLTRGYVIDAKAMDQVRTGASAEQILVVMGTPSTTSTVGGDAWYYISQKTERSLAFMQPKITDQRVFAVYFDKNKKVQRVANYGLEDGKLIDFVTRTTPTAGAESSFVRNMLTNLLRFS
ncbi:MAG: SmpA/OmlA domain protein [Hyphomicrobiales bacterium]|nr:SmpA/OmlA domain protein [Hyphomicrobiales bacterium]